MGPQTIERGIYGDTGTCHTQCAAELAGPFFKRFECEWLVSGDKWLISRRRKMLLDPIGPPLDAFLVLLLSQVVDQALRDGDIEARPAALSSH
jgi:hypothetical protein